MKNWLLSALVLTQSCLFGYEDRLVQTQEVMNIQNKAASFLESRLDQTLLYDQESEQEYLSEFPFEFYFKAHVPTQGAFYLDSYEDYIKSRLMKGIVWEPHIDNLIGKFVTKGSTAIDLGSHIGIHTMKMSDAAGESGAVIAFEPNPKLYRELCFNLAINDKNNVLPLRYAVGNHNKCIKMRESFSDNEGASFIVEAEDDDFDSFMIKLDDLNLKKVSLIKIDVENDELDVLHGSLKTIINNRPVIIIEVQANTVKASIRQEDLVLQKKQVFKMLEDLDYQLIFLSLNDYIAIPKNLNKTFDES